MIDDPEMLRRLRLRARAVVEWLLRAADATVEGGMPSDYHPRRGFHPPRTSRGHGVGRVRIVRGDGTA
ncbi:MAG: hypothetical protein KatS3mg115_2462 [Candidatus Poribacteria bacterium]|nr:MAG: hypothetical protein KatS3mg115_2462 [Candidatus Poribacteria bacterium]